MLVLLAYAASQLAILCLTGMVCSGLARGIGETVFIPPNESLLADDMTRCAVLAFFLTGVKIRVKWWPMDLFEKLLSHINNHRYLTVAG